MAYPNTSRVIAIDMDGNHLAVFGGYDAPEPAVIFSKMPAVTRVIVRNRLGNTHETHWRDQ